MNNDDTFSQIKRVLTLSQFEVIVTVFLLVGLAFYVGVSVFNSNEYVRQSYEVFQNTSPVYTNYEQVSWQINSNQYVANATIFVVWAITGLLAFYTTLVLWGSEKSIAQLVRMLRSGSEGRRLALEERLVQYAIRILAIIALLLFTGFFVKSVLPLLIVWTQVTPDKAMIEYILSVIWVWLSVAISMHIVIVLLRCAALRQRLIS